MLNSHTKFEVFTTTCNEEMKRNAKCKNSRFEPPFGGLRNVLLALTAAALLNEICRNQRFLKGWVTLELKANFR